MLVFLARLRDLVVAVALAWVGVSVQTEPDSNAADANARPAVVETTGGSAEAGADAACPTPRPSTRATLQCVDTDCPKL